MGIEGRDKARHWRRVRSRFPASSARPSSACARPITCRFPNFPSSPASPNRSSARSSATRPIRHSPPSGGWRRRSMCRSSACLQVSEDEPFLEKSSKGDTPILVSDDGKCRLSIIGWIKTVEWLQWYGFPPSPAACSNLIRISAARSNVFRSPRASCRSRSRAASSARGRARPCAIAATGRM